MRFDQLRLLERGGTNTGTEIFYLYMEFDSRALMNIIYSID